MDKQISAKNVIQLTIFIVKALAPLEHLYFRFSIARLFSGLLIYGFVSNLSEGISVLFFDTSYMS